MVVQVAAKAQVCVRSLTQCSELSCCSCSLDSVPSLETSICCKYGKKIKKKKREREKRSCPRSHHIASAVASSSLTNLSTHKKLRPGWSNSHSGPQSRVLHLEFGSHVVHSADPVPTPPGQKGCIPGLLTCLGDCWGNVIPSSDHQCQKVRHMGGISTRFFTSAEGRRCSLWVMSRQASKHMQRRKNPLFIPKEGSTSVPFPLVRSGRTFFSVG